MRAISESRSDSDVIVRPLDVGDLPAADRIMRLAFGTYIGLPDPMTFMGDASPVLSRTPSDAIAAFAAWLGADLVGLCMAANWGSVAVLGPLAVLPDLWDRGIGWRLMERTVAHFDEWGATFAGLFTFPNSQKHLGLYQKFGFWPRFLTAVMAKPVAPARRMLGWTALSSLPGTARDEALAGCRKVTDAVCEGLDLTREIRAVADQDLGETVLLRDGGDLRGMAVCHCGPGTEAGSGTCYVKFGAVRPGAESGRDFGRLLDACEEMAAGKGVARVLAGVNTARHEAYREMLARGFRIDFQGVAMHRPNVPGYNRPGVYAIDDWR